MNLFEDSGRADTPDPKTAASASSTGKKRTPLMEQYNAIKAENPDKYVFFRLGDFYELFAEDAEIVSRLLGLTLTKRMNVPMCGVPHHQLENYTRRLIDQGKKIAIVEQVGPLPEKGSSTKIVHREVTEILTPGTTSDWHTLDEKENNYLLGLVARRPSALDEPTWTACTLDVSTGEVEIFDWGHHSPERIADEIHAIRTREILLRCGEGESKRLTNALAQRNASLVVGDLPMLTEEETQLANLETEFGVRYGLSTPGEPRKTLMRLWKISTPLPANEGGSSPAGKVDSPSTHASNAAHASHVSHANMERVLSSPATDEEAMDSSMDSSMASSIASSVALGQYTQYLEVLLALLRYAGDEHRRSLNHLKLPTLVEKQAILHLDATVIKDLELFTNSYDGTKANTLMSVLDNTKTAMGARLLRRMVMRPLALKTAIHARLERVTWFYKRPSLLSDFRKDLKDVQDIERLIGRLGMSKLSPRELSGLALSFAAIERLWQHLASEDEKFKAEKSSAEKSSAEKPSAEKPSAEKPPADFFWESEGLVTFWRSLMRSKETLPHLTSRTGMNASAQTGDDSDSAKTGTDLATMKTEEATEVMAPEQTEIDAASVQVKDDAASRRGEDNAASRQGEDDAALERKSFAPVIAFLKQSAEHIQKKIVDEPPNDFGEGGIMREEAYPSLAELHKEKRTLHQHLSDLWAKEKVASNIPTLKVKYTDNMGYFFEVTKSYAKSVPEYFERKQTLMGGERFVTEALLHLEKQIRENTAAITELERELYERLLSEVRAGSDLFQQLGTVIAYLDVWSSLAQIALDRRYVCPVFDPTAELIYEGGRHPVVEMLEQEPFVSNALRMNKETSVLHIITGPNMAGKSTFLRQTALLVIMAHIGSYVPASKFLLPVFDSVFTRIGASDHLAKGESTFLVEMNETANILRHATSRSLVIMDEIGRGTSAYDGLAIAWSVLEFLSEDPKQSPYTLFATHYHEVTQLARQVGVENYTFKILEEGTKLVFLRRIAKGVAGKSYGIHVARMAGLPRSVIAQARDRLLTIEEQSAQAAAASGSEHDDKHEDVKARIAIRQKEFYAREHQFEALQAKMHQLSQFFERIDINKITPIEAFRYLSELQDLILNKGDNDTIEDGEKNNN